MSSHHIASYIPSMSECILLQQVALSTQRVWWFRFTLLTWGLVCADNELWQLDIFPVEGKCESLIQLSSSWQCWYSLGMFMRACHCAWKGNASL